MNNEPLVGVKACVFNAYGTLFDFASGAKRCQDVLGDGIEKLTALWRDKQLQYTWLIRISGRSCGVHLWCGLVSVETS
jgi:2-haloacid dehalogenase